MTTVKPIKPDDRLPITHEPLMLATSKARSMAWVLGELAEADGSGKNPVHAFDGTGAPEEALGWTRSVVTDALRASLDEIETEYRTTKDGA
jgi:hypothetical protein